MPNWVKVRSDLSPQRDGYVMLDSTNLQTAAATGDADWTYPTVTAVETSVSGAQTFTSTWSAHGTDPVRYRLLSNGMVQLDGAVVQTVTVNTGGPPTNTQKTFDTYYTSGLWYGKRPVLFQMPAGYRPDLSYSGGTSGWPTFICAGGGTWSTNAGRPTPAKVAITNDYNGWYVTVMDCNIGVTDELWLNTLSWYAEQ